MLTWRKRKSRGFILLYHRIALESYDPLLLSVSPKHFASHLKILKKNGALVPLATLLSSVASANSDKPFFSITFDDGYANNLSEAQPLLDSVQAPATVFISTKHLTHEGGFWWDELEHLLLHSPHLPACFEGNIGKDFVRWNLEKDFDFRDYRDWNVLSPAKPTQRHRFFCYCLEALRPFSDEMRGDFLQSLKGWAQLDSNSIPTRRPLSRKEVVALSQIATIGAHTHTHALLSAHCSREQAKEIRRSKEELSRILPSPPTLFAYPYGDKSHYTAETPQLVENEGFRLAVSNFPGTVTQNTSAFEMPRHMVFDWPEEKFAAWLNGLLSV